MNLSVIGSGLGRTGTLSLKLALDKLGVGPCYHMVELWKNQGHLKFWFEALEKESDWDFVFKGYESTVDWPSTHYWQELFDLNPNAKVIHTVRDPESWYKSVMNTIYPSITRVDTPDADGVSFHGMTNRMILEETFHGKILDKEYALDIFQKHTEKVKEIVPAEQLLIYDLSEGWEPLCEFLGVDIPQEEFPRSNSTESFRKSIGL